jgi:general secretion pathway protein C
MALAMLLGLSVAGVCAQQPQDSSTDSPELHNYKLVGTVEGNPSTTGAVFEDPQTKTQKLYRIGDVVDGATIVEIKNQQVLLRRGELIELIDITGGSPVKRAPGDEIPVIAASNDPRENLQGVLSQVLPPYDPRVKKLRKAVSRDAMDRFVAHFSASGEPPKFVDTFAGPALTVASVDPSLLSSLGLHQTDLIVGISGMGIDSPDRLTQIWQMVGRAKVVDISVLRGRKVQPLYYMVK